MKPHLKQWCGAWYVTSNVGTPNEWLEPAIQWATKKNQQRLGYSYPFARMGSLDLRYNKDRHGF